MPIRFSPYRQGASHSLEPSDLVLLRGSTIYHDNKYFDTRILVRSNGHAQRALWLDEHPTPEFHYWEYRITESDCDQVKQCLGSLATEFKNLDVPFDGNDTGDFLTFWVDGTVFNAHLHTGPPEMLTKYSDSQIRSFQTVTQLLYSLLPQKHSVALDPIRNPQTS